MWSDEILNEVARALERSLGYSPEQVTRRLDAMRQAFPEASVPVPADMPQAFQCVPDPDDRHVLCAAVRGQAYAVVTLNKRDFPRDCLEEYGLVRQTPDDFLTHQYHLNPLAVLETLDIQASATRRPRKELIAILRSCAPNFCELLSNDYPRSRFP